MRGRGVWSPTLPPYSTKSLDVKILRKEEANGTYKKFLTQGILKYYWANYSENGKLNDEGVSLLKTLMASEVYNFSHQKYMVKRKIVHMMATNPEGRQVLEHFQQKGLEILCREGSL